MYTSIQIALHSLVPVWVVSAGTQEARSGAGVEQPAATLAEARELLTQGSYERAEAAFMALAGKAGEGPAAELGLAQCRLHTGRYEEGLAGLTELEANQSADWHFWVAVFHQRLAGDDEVLRHARAAIDSDKNHASARLLLAQTLERLGRRPEAVEAYRWFDEQLSGRRDLPRDAPWLTAVAQGFLRYSVLTQTHVVSRTKYVLRELLQVAYTQLDRTYWPARIAAAELLREKYNNNEHDGSVSDYTAALRINEHLPEAHVGMGEVALASWWFEEVEKRAEQALTVNPRFAPAHHLLAKKLIVERRYGEAQEMAEKALAVNVRDVIAMSLIAAAAACRYDGETVERLRKVVEQIDPKCALFHRAVGDALSGIRQYAASEREYKKAIEFDATDANARTELGLMYMQWGLEDKARDALDGAWNLDPFNERTKNTLDLLDSLQKFDRHETPNFVIRHEAKTDPGIGEFLAAFLDETYEAVTKDFGATPDAKTVIEVFPTQAAFAVRITGRPWIHTVGACTGRVIALASPRRGDDRMGPFHLGRVLRHEFTHTVTLAATENRIPHWFTEGLAVYQEDAPRSFDWVELLAEAARRGELFTLESIDWGFIRPRRPQDRTLAYAQSEWMCEYIVERYGYEIIHAMLARFKSGGTQPEVFRQLLGIGLEEFDRDFAAWAKRQIAAWGFDATSPEDVTSIRSLAEAQPDDAAAQGRLARAAYDADDPELALAAARRALELDTQEINGLTVLAKLLAAKIRQERNDASRREVEETLLSAAELLERLQPNGWLGPKLLSEVWLLRNDWEKAADCLQRLQRLCPFDPASWRGLAGIYLQQGDLDRALPQLLELARSEEHDPDVAGQIADIFRQRGRLREAQHWYRQALMIDPFDVGGHQSLGDTAMQAGDTRSALQSYLMLTRLEPGNVRHYENAALAAHKLGETDGTRRMAAKAVELDPKSTARTLLPP